MTIENNNSPQLPVTHDHDHECQSSKENSSQGCCGGQSCQSNIAPQPKALCEDSVREQLKQVIDPELFVNIVDLGLVYVVDVTPNAEDNSKQDVAVEMTLTSPMCPAGPQLVAGSRQVIEAMANVGSVDIKVVMDPPWTQDRMSEDAKDQLNIF